jgi:methylmalonyl-CoA mutase N-terminal domain/subunit
MMRDEFGALNPHSMSVAITSHTSGLSLTACQPINNVVRGTIQALALVLAGVQALEISAFDEAYRTPSKDAHIVGLRTQQILDLEAGLAKVQDPLGGSYFVESLTDQIEKRILERIREIEAMGDPEDLSANGFFREIFHQAMEDSQRGVEKGDVPLVGVNIHTLAEKDDRLLRDVAASKIETWYSHTKTIEGFKRDGLDGIVTAVAGSENLIPAVIEALDSSATIGEIVTTMRSALGMPPDIFDHPLPGRESGGRYVA